MNDKKRNEDSTEQSRPPARPQASPDGVTVASVKRTISATRGSQQPLGVLIVDDCQDTADSLAMLVKLWGHDLRVAYSGNAALEISAAFPADVVLLDIGMPGMSGFQVARLLRLQVHYRQTLLVAVTGWSDPANRLSGKTEGFDYYLIKPADLATLEALLLLKRAQGTHSHLRDSAIRPLITKHAHVGARPPPRQSTRRERIVDVIPDIGSTVSMRQGAQEASLS